VYRAIGGSYWARVLVMAGTTLFFWLKMMEHQVRMMHADGCLFSLREWGFLLRFAFVTPGVFPLLWRTYFAYYRPSFHPHQVECSDLLEAWRRQYEQEPVYRQSRFSPASAKSAPLAHDGSTASAG
jgi:predicted metal-dependent hydrolase